MKRKMMGKIAMFLCFLGFILLMGLPCFAVATTNLLINGGFEQLDSTNRSVGWYQDAWNPGAFLAVTREKAHSGRYAAVLQAEQANDIRLIQSVTVEPGAVYRFSGWIATRGVRSGGTGNDNNAGANLSVLGGTVFQAGLTGDHGWQYQQFTFRTNPGQTQIQLGIRLGFYGQTYTGCAYFDNLKLEKLNPPPAVFQQLDKPQLQLADLGRLEAPPLGVPQPQSSNPQSSPLRWFFPVCFGLFFAIALLGIRFWARANTPYHRQSVRPLEWSADRLLPSILLSLTFVSWFLKVLFWGAGWPAAFGAGLFPIHWGAAGPVPQILAMICDTFTAWLLFFCVRRHSLFRAFGIALFYLYLPPLFFNWRMDLWGSLLNCSIAFIYFLYIRKQFTGFILGAMILLLSDIRGVVLLPLLWQYGIAVKQDEKGKMRARAFWVAVILVAAVIITLGRAFGTDSAVSGGAANLGVLFDWNHRPLGAGPLGLLFHPGKVLFLLLGGGFFYLSGRQKRVGLGVLGGAWMGMALFLCWPGLGDGGLLPAVTLLLLALGLYRDPKFLFASIILSISMFFNIYTVIMNPPFADRLFYILIIVNTTLFGWLTLEWLFRIYGRAQGGWLQIYRGYSRSFQFGLAEKLHLPPFVLSGGDYWRLAILATVYACLLFFALGSRATPQTGYDFASPAQGVEIQLGQSSNIRTFAFFDAEGTGRIQASYERNGVWTKAEDFSCDNYYVMRREAVAWQGVDRLRIIPEPSAGHINEIAFLDPENRLIAVQSIKYLDTGRAEAALHSPLFDEQNRMREKPSYFNSTYFDEIYHGRTAYEFVKGTPVYENTHPPLGKDFLALGILLFGMNPFGMRVMHALAGLCLILTLFFLGRMVLATRFGAYGLMLLGMFDFMPLVQSRYATIDSTSVLLITLMFLFTFQLIRQQLKSATFAKILGTTVLIIIFFALAAATKWTALYGAAGVLFIFIVSGLERSKTMPSQSVQGPKTKGFRETALNFWTSYSWWKFFGCVFLIFILIVPALYYLTYIPYLKASGISTVFSGAGFRAVLANQAGMYQYHSQLKATHPFSSSWWSWPFNFKPLWLYTDSYAPPGRKGSIVSLGNPLIWYLGLLGLAILFYSWIKGRRKRFLTYLFACFCAQYLPWVLVSRVAFIYHFYPVLPWFLICVVLCAEPIWHLEQGKYRNVLYIGGCVMILIFLLFLPVLVGMDVPQGYIDNFLRWFPRDWYF